MGNKEERAEKVADLIQASISGLSGEARKEQERRWDKIFQDMALADPFGMAVLDMCLNAAMNVIEDTGIFEKDFDEVSQEDRERFMEQLAFEVKAGLVEGLPVLEPEVRRALFEAVDREAKADTPPMTKH